jgi:HSP20 family protein
MVAEHDLLKKFLAIQERINSVFEDSVASLQGGLEVDLGANWSPPVDVYETAHEWVLTAEIPGMDQEKVDVRIVDHVLYVKGERELAADMQKHTFHRLERPTGRFERKFELPDGVDRDSVSARMENGVLTVVLPKHAVRRRSIQVEVRKNKAEGQAANEK